MPRSSPSSRTWHHDRMTARLDVLTAGYAGDRVASTVVLIRDGDSVIVVDPGMVAGRRQILGPLTGLGVQPAQVTDVVLSHHHPDHTLNAALFEQARVHDFWAIYSGDEWIDRPADGFAVSPSVTLMATPGHTAQDITTLAITGSGLAACTHLWWSQDGPVTDPLAQDQAQLERSRSRLLARGPDLIVPAHGAPFPAALL
jgi:glyoxylase-like metal-dependent hydrolase (beta-lactamase superfamily II)